MRAATLLVVACFALGCSTPGETRAGEELPGGRPGEGDPGGPADVAATAPAQPAWTETFLPEAVLMAGSVHIEGPPGLRDHLALVQDLDAHRYEAKTTEKGLLQTVFVRDDVQYLAPIRVHLDNLTILAERELIVLERPGWVPVTVEAEGDCFYRRTDSEEEQRGPSLRLVGQAR